MKLHVQSNRDFPHKKCARAKNYNTARAKKMKLHKQKPIIVREKTYEISRKKIAHKKKQEISCEKNSKVKKPPITRSQN